MSIAKVCLINVPGRPVVNPSNKTITAVYGQPLTLTMEFCANPSFNKVFWIAKQKVYIPGDADTTVIAYGITVRLCFFFLATMCFNLTRI